MQQHLAQGGTTPSNKPKALPDASEEDWQRRAEKRQKAVADVKVSPEYVAFMLTRSAQGAAGPTGVVVPRTPDAVDRATGKRHWEKEVREWRKALRQWGPGDGQEPSIE